MRNSMVTALVLAGVTASASADSADLTFVGRGLGWGNKITLDGVSTNYVFTGELLHEFSNGTGALSALDGRTFTTFCTDVEQEVSSTGATYQAVDLATIPDTGTESLGMGADRAQAIRNVLAYADTSQTGFVDRVDARNFAAAMQFVIWEIVYEFDPTAGDDGLASIDITSGRFSATQTRYDRALSSGIMRYFNTLRDSGIHFGAGANVLGLSSPDNQDQVLRSVPLPSAVSMGLASLGLLATRRRR